LPQKQSHSTTIRWKTAHQRVSWNLCGEQNTNKRRPIQLALHSSRLNEDWLRLPATQTRHLFAYSDLVAAVGVAMLVNIDYRCVAIST
jgi:hypothetical protein